MAQSITTPHDSLTSKIFKYWLPVALMFAVMYGFSTDNFSNDNTRGLIQVVVDWLFRGASESTVMWANYVIRKAAHFTEYAVLTGLLFRALRANSLAGWKLKWAAWSFAISVGWALVDEMVHQTHTMTRSGSINDALLDSTGALFMLTVLMFLNRQSDCNR
jgi:VanZ family protein